MDAGTIGIVFAAVAVGMTYGTYQILSISEVVFNNLCQHQVIPKIVS